MEPAYLLAITYDLRAHDPETKYFLIKLLQVYGLNYPVTIKVKELANQLGLWDQEVTIATKVLTDHGFLEVERLKAQKDLPARTLKCVRTDSPEYNGTNRHGDEAPLVPPSHHQELIDHLLHPDPIQRGQTKTSQRDKENTPRRHPLSITNRLLLIVLLRYADSGGAVRQLGLKDLEYLTGISQSKLENQIEKLKREGYIRSSYRGITGKRLFGASKGGYFLNLSHLAYGEAANPGIIIYTEGPLSLHTCLPEQANEIYRLQRAFTGCDATAINQEIKQAKDQSKAAFQYHRANGKTIDIPTSTFVTVQMNINRLFPNTTRLAQYLMAANHYVPRTWKFAEIHKLFSDLEDPHNHAHLQIRLSELASTLLTDHWHELENRAAIPWANHMQLASWVRELLSKSFRASEHEEAHHTKRQIQLLERFLFSTARRFARQIQAAIKQVDGIPHRSMIYTILPRPDAQPRSRTRGITIQCLFKTPTAISGNHVIELTQESLIKPVTFIQQGNEAELTEEQSYLYGLRTSQKKVFNFDWKHKNADE
jgi:DNA-binding MarR family transcriptional regulator